MLFYVPLMAFVLLLILGRVELGWRWIVAMVLLWIAGLLGVLLLTDWPITVFCAIQAVLVIVLTLKVFGGDVRIGRFY